MLDVMKSAHVAIAWFDAPICPACAAELAERFSICRECRETIPFVAPPLCPVCGGENSGIFDLCLECIRQEERPWSHGLAVARMEGVARTLILRLKYAGETAIARTLGYWAAEKWNESGLDADAVIPMPVHWTRRSTHRRAP